MFRKSLLFAAAAFLLCSNTTEEGMFPLSDLGRVDLQKAGLKIPTQEIFNPNGTSLIDAVVRVGGCTGSFVSDDGLVITNHHCAFGAVAAASTPARNYARDGFLANNRTEEIPVKGMTCRITASYEDVSDKVLAEAKSISDPVERIKNIRAKMNSIARDERVKDSSLQYEVSEMFTGKSYVLFRYKTILDVRLVYVPARSIGEFGGEKDNWEWPRHSGDFAFLRAYTSVDGKPAAYDPGNLPYKPVKYLKVNPEGVKENDFIFILGYPGRTFRHQPSQFVQNQQEHVLPYISSLYDWQIQKMEEAGKGNDTIALRVAGKMKSLANVAKNYRGKMQGLKRTHLLENKIKEEKAIQQFIKNDASLQSKYGNLFSEIDRVYKDILTESRKNLWLDQVENASAVYRAAAIISSMKKSVDKLSSDERKIFIEKNGEMIKNQINLAYQFYEPGLDRMFFERILLDAQYLPTGQRITAYDELIKDSKNPSKTINDFLNTAYSSKSLLSNPDKVRELMNKDLMKLLNTKDKLIEFASKVNEQQEQYQQLRLKRDGELNALMASLVDVKSQFAQSGFVPDANATLRLTYGYVRGYRPSDGQYHQPFTTLKGVLEKNASSPEYDILPILEELYSAKDFGPYAINGNSDVAVNLLYNLDTTGGNSGSPILDAWGRLIGVNFDRSFTATINDYAWNENYSRSVGVDIRYVLFVLQKVAKADHLIKEMGVNN